MATLAVHAIAGLLPIAFVVFISVAVQRLSEGALGPTWASACRWLGAAAAAFVLHQVVAAAQLALSQSVARRVDAYCNLRFTQSAFDTTTLRTIERPDVADKMSHANETFEQWGLTPGSATEGALALTARYVQLAAALVIVAVAFGRQVMVAAAVVALVARRGQSAGFFRWGQVIRALRPMQRKLAYVRDVATGSGAAKEIRTLGLVDWIDRRYVAEDAAYLDTMWTWRRRVYGRPFAVYALIALVATGVALTVASSKSVAGDLSIGAVVLGVQGIVLCARFGVLFPESDVKMVFGRAGWDAVLEFQEICRTSDEEAGADVVPVREEGSAATATSPYRPVTGIAFENVRFAYDTHEVLHGLDLTLPVGTSTALVGVNGAGKTTLIKLLTGLYAPTSGRIAVDGVDLRTIPSSTWQRVFAVTFQDYNRYEMSLRDNVAMGCIAHRDDTDGIIASVRRAGLGDLLGELPGGIDTPLTQHVEGGRELSGGQWQRLALARAMFAIRHGASILILDEPTAQLDARGEAEFYEDFLDITRGVTSLIISHRFSSVRRADRIVVLDGGRIRESGTHDELVASGDLYADMFAIQARRFEATGDRA